MYNEVHTHRMINNNNNNDDLYEVIMNGCSHKNIWTGRKLASPIESRYSVGSSTKEDYFVCERCSEPSRYGVRDFCMDSVLHKLLRVRKLSPLEKRSISLIR